MQASMMGVALLAEGRAGNRQSDDWDQDLARLRWRAERYEMQQAIEALAVRIAAFFRRPTQARRAIHA